MALRMTMLTHRPVSPPLWSRLKYLTNSWMDCHEMAQIHGAQMMNANDFGGPRTFPLARPPGQSFHLSCEISQHSLDELGHKLVQTFMVPR